MFESIKQIATDLWAIEDIATTEHAMWYVLRGSHTTLVFDTGLGLSPILPIIKKISDQSVVAYLSHAHFDHAGGAHEISQVFGWNGSDMVEASRRGVANSIVRTQVDENFWVNAPKTLKTIPFPQLRYVKDSEVIDIGGYKLEVIYAPGHSPSSLCLYERSKGWLFTGDVAYHGPIYLHLSDSNLHQYKKTIEKLIQLNVKRVFPGHNDTELGRAILTEIKSLLEGGRESKKYPRLHVRKEDWSS